MAIKISGITVIYDNIKTSNLRLNYIVIIAKICGG
jgi:hypothetical protein